MALFGALIGPVALAWGLQRTSGTSASLMLALEAAFTAVLAWRLYGESMDRRVWTAMLLLLAGGILLVIDQSSGGAAQAWGLLAVMVATAAWGLDNALSRAVAERDPSQVVMLKSGLGVMAAAALAVLRVEPLPAWSSALALLLVGATGYGLSLRCYLLAQRAFGEERANELLTSALPKQDPLQLLREAPPDAMAQLLKEEHPAVVTVVLTQLPARNVAAILAAMPRELTADLLARLAGVSHVPEQAVAEISQTLAHALSAAGPAADSGSSEGFDGQAFADAVSRELQHARGGRGDDLATASEPLVAKLRGAS